MPATIAQHIINMFEETQTTFGHIRNMVTGETRRIYKHKGALAPTCVEFSNRVCAYWETREELFTWACQVSGFDPEKTEFIDGFSGELLTHEDLIDEACEEEF